MTNKLINLTLISGLSALLLVTNAYAVNPEVGLGADQADMEQRIEKGREALYDKLSLTPEQKEQLDKHREANKVKVQEVVKKLKDKNTALKEELDKYASNEKTVKQLTNDINSLQGEVLDQRVNSILAVKKILTLEQYEQLQTLEKQRMEQRKEQRKGMVPPPPGKIKK